MAYSAAELAKTRADLMNVVTGRVAHVAPTSALATADATTPATAAALATALCGAMATHYASVVDAAGAGCHAAADAINPSTEPASLSSAENMIRGSLRAHFGRSDIHFAADSVAIAALYDPRNGSLDEVYRGLNASKAALNLHYASALSAAVPA